MNIRPGFQRFLAVLFLTLLIFVCTTSFTQAQTGSAGPVAAAEESGITGTGIVPGGPGFIMVSPFAFQPHAVDSPWAYLNSSVYNPSLVTVANLHAALALPHGATITKMTVYYLDNAAQDFSLWLERGDGLRNLTIMAEYYSSGTAVAYRYDSVTSILNPIIDNQMYSYILTLSIPSGSALTNLAVTNVRIDYDYPVSLALLAK